MKFTVKRRLFIILALVLILAFLTAFLLQDAPRNPSRQEQKFYVGVEVAYGKFEEARIVADRVKNYTNLFVISSLDVTMNRTLLDKVCDYLHDAGFYFIVQLTSPVKYHYDTCKWVAQARLKYGDKFLGVYYFDEPGGKQLDKEENRFVIEAENFTDAANTYVEYLYAHAESYMSTGVDVLTADYALYWFDYKAEYDAVLAEFGWNFSRPLHVALCRGAALAYHRDWGVIITWKYWNPPYMESGEELFDDMVLAYRAGAKYIVVFDYGKRQLSPYGIFFDEHFEAIKAFWEYAQKHPEEYGVLKAEAAYVLPKDYGFGFRSANDTIWGLWEADDRAKQIWMQVNSLLENYGLGLDIIYEDGNLKNYLRLFFWNGTVSEVG